VEDAPLAQIWVQQSCRCLMGARVCAFLDVIDQSFPNRVFVPQN